VSQQNAQHRREIWASLCIGYGVVSGIEWDRALAADQAVGTCSACQGVMKPLPAENRGQRVVYPARCAGCGREVEGMGPRVERPPKGAA
jgi:hypothetical protein